MESEMKSVMKFLQSTQESGRTISADVLEKTRRHPCYSFQAHTKHARMHLPVAPRCNVGCNYCNRKYDCVNESRPGVTSELLSPEKAQAKFQQVRERVEELTVVGIAGPGDALANWEETREAIGLIREMDQDIVFCLSTNGLMLPEYAKEIVELDIQHVTVTVNCIDPEIGAKIYRFVRYKGTRYEGVEAAALLLEKQLEGIRLLVKDGVLVKVNIVMMKGVNDEHVPDVVAKLKELGVFICNIMPFIPAPGSVFEKYPQTSMKEINAMRDRCQVDLQQMRHCQQCRADAIGLLREDRSAEFRENVEVEETLQTKTLVSTGGQKYRIAVTSKYGILVDQHFGHATEFLVFEGNKDNFSLVEIRKMSNKGHLGLNDCEEDKRVRNTVTNLIGDCDAVLTMRIGRSPQKKLLEKGIMSVEYCYTVNSGLSYVIEQLELKCAI